MGFVVQRVYGNSYKWIRENRDKVIFSWRDNMHEVHAVGNTYPVRQLLKQAGFKWYNGNRAWILKLPEPKFANPDDRFDTEKRRAAELAVFAEWYKNFKPVEEEIKKTAPVVWIAWGGPSVIYVIDPEKVGREEGDVIERPARRRSSEEDDDDDEPICDEYDYDPDCDPCVEGDEFFC